MVWRKINPFHIHNSSTYVQKHTQRTGCFASDFDPLSEEPFFDLFLKYFLFLHVLIRILFWSSELKPRLLQYEHSYSRKSTVKFKIPTKYDPTFAGFCYFVHDHTLVGFLIYKIRSWENTTQCIWGEKRTKSASIYCVVFSLTLNFAYLTKRQSMIHHQQNNKNSKIIKSSSNLSNTNKKHFILTVHFKKYNVFGRICMTSTWVYLSCFWELFSNWFFGKGSMQENFLFFNIQMRDFERIIKLLTKRFCHYCHHSRLLIRPMHFL